MALPRGMFHPKWTTHHRQTVNSAAQCRVEVYRVVSRGTWTAETGVGPDVLEYLYRGPARWQKLARPNNRDFVEDQAKFQQTRVQIGFEDNELPDKVLDIPVNAVVKMLENPSDPALVGTRVYVHGHASSSNAWQRNLDCQENMKQGD
jgi:hypothetical protein